MVARLDGGHFKGFAQFRLLEPAPVFQPHMDGDIINRRRLVRGDKHILPVQRTMNALRPGADQVVGVFRMNEPGGGVHPIAKNRHLPGSARPRTRLVGQFPGHHRRVIAVNPAVHRVAAVDQAGEVIAIQLHGGRRLVKTRGEFHEPAPVALGHDRPVGIGNVPAGDPADILGEAARPLPVIGDEQDAAHVSLRHFRQAKIQALQQRLVVVMRRPRDAARNGPGQRGGFRAGQQAEVVHADLLQPVQFPHHPRPAARQRRVTQVTAIPQVGPDIKMRPAAQVKPALADADKVVDARGAGAQRRAAGGDEGQGQRRGSQKVPPRETWMLHTCFLKMGPMILSHYGGAFSI